MQSIVSALVTFSLVFIAATAQDVALQFSIDTPVVGGFTEGTCSFETTTAGQTISSVRWTHNTSLQLSHGERISITTSSLSGGVTSGNSRLEIDSIQHNDAGDYSCIVVFSNPSLEKTSNNVGLSIASELVVSAEPEQTAVEGGFAQLRCNVTSNPSPRIKWLRIEDGSEQILANQNFEDSDFGVYNISNSVSVSQAGTYRCTGQYNFGVESKDIELVVLTVPVITTVADDVRVLYNSSVQLNCNATGIKDPTYKWLYGEREIVNEGDGGRVRVDQEKRYLKLESVSYDDDGEYTCIAETGAGSDNITYTLSVEGPPEILLAEREVEVVVPGNSLVELECPFRSLPLPNVKWDKLLANGRREEINSLAGGFTIFQENGSLLIWNVSQSQASFYDCILSNKHGSDNRTFFLRVIELPHPPEGLSVVERGGDYIRLTWSPASSSAIRPVDLYLLELTYYERQTISTTRNVSSELTLYLADNLVPGVEYNITLRSSNLAGLSTPTGSVHHNTTTARPKLEFFKAESLGDGRSVLLQWKLQYSGGHPVDQFIIEVKVNDEVKLTLKPDVYNNSLLLDDLRPTTDYTFEAVVGNSLGLATPLHSNVSTTIAAPGKPTTPEQESRSPQTLTLSFSVKYGSYPIDYYLLLVSEPSDLTNTSHDYTNNTEFVERLMNFSSKSVRKQDPWREDGEVVGYHVQLRVGGLQQRQNYVFSVAAASRVGVGAFSQPSRTLTLEDGELFLYLIVCGVVGGVLLLLVILIVVCFVGQFIRRQHRGGKITITRRGSDSTGVATDYNLKFESFNGNQGTTSPNSSQRVDSTTPPPPPRVTSPRVTSPFLSNAHYYNSLRKYQLDTLPVHHPEEGKDRVVEIQVHSNLHNGDPHIHNIKKTGSDAVDGGHYSRPTSHPPSLPPSSQPPPFLPPPSLPTSTTLPSLPTTSSQQKHPSYNHPTSQTLYNVPRTGNHSQMMSMSALPTANEGSGQVLGVIGSGANTLPRGVTSSEDYTVMERVIGGRGSLVETARRFHSMNPKTVSIEVSQEEAMHQGYQTDV